MSNQIRLKHDQEARLSVYCLGEHHIAVVDALYPYSGAPHQIELTPCDCPKAAPHGETTA